jgi:hypothetical protein
MKSITDVLTEIGVAAPSLRAWADDLKADALSVTGLCTHLSAALNEHRRGSQIPELAALAPVIETLLADFDNDDEISLGLIEPLTWSALDGTLAPEATRQALGSSARQVWDGLYFDARRHDLRAVEYREQSLGVEPEAPARLEEWLARPGRWADANTPLARLTVGARRGHLELRTRCWIDRLAAPAPHELELGELLLYVAPEALGVPKDQSLVALVFSWPAA